MNRLLTILATAPLIASCAQTPPAVEESASPDYYGTLEPMASDAVYFVVTDRFVDGDPGNNYPEQGGRPGTQTFDRPIRLENERPANIGYLGGDFRGIVDQAGYISDMGFSALWLTPIVDNPNEAFTGGTAPGQGGFFTDRGKAGYHGYWGVNFFVEDEHLVSPGLDFDDLAAALSDRDIKVILDVVCNHGSPSYTMPEDQPMFGELYDASGTLVADHENLHPSRLDPDNPLHAFYNTEPDLAELSDLNENNPDVLDYFVDAYLQWIDAGAAAFRVDTIKHMPDSYWKAFADRIRAEHPDFFMFAESYSYDAEEIARHTWPQNGSISVLDFPGQAAISGVFGSGGAYTELLDYLHLESQLYQNPYELMTFYDNHDMPRMAADDAGFINAHNWLFTTRGTPVIYYGSEIGFRAGAREHGGNRDYFGADNIDLARHHPVRRALAAIGEIRRNSPALQRGLQVNLEFSDDTAAFYRVFRHGGIAETALVLLNKGAQPAAIEVGEWRDSLEWRDAASGKGVRASTVEVPANGVVVLLADAVPTAAATRARLDQLMATARRD